MRTRRRIGSWWKCRPGKACQASLFVYPPGWRVNELQGLDSYVGEVIGHRVRLIFDYGAYSPPLNYEDDPEVSYAVFYETIGDIEAKLVAPISQSGGITGVYFKRLGGPNLTLWGEDLTAAQRHVAFAIFRSIRSGDGADGTSNEASPSGTSITMATARICERFRRRTWPFQSSL